MSKKPEDEIVKFMLGDGIKSNILRVLTEAMERTAKLAGLIKGAEEGTADPSIPAEVQSEVKAIATLLGTIGKIGKSEAVDEEKSDEEEMEKALDDLEMAASPFQKAGRKISRSRLKRLKEAIGVLMNLAGELDGSTEKTAKEKEEAEKAAKEKEEAEKIAKKKEEEEKAAKEKEEAEKLASMTDEEKAAKEKEEAKKAAKEKEEAEKIAKRDELVGITKLALADLLKPITDRLDKVEALSKKQAVTVDEISKREGLPSSLGSEGASIGGGDNVSWPDDLNEE